MSKRACLSCSLRNVRDNASNKPELTEAELLSWARKRGVVTFFIFFSIAVGVAVWFFFIR